MDEQDNPGPPREVATARSEPAFNIPSEIMAFIGVMVAIHIVRYFILDEQMEQGLLFLTAFLPARYLFPLAEQDMGWLLGPVTYSLLHGGATHLALNSLWLAVFGTPVARRIGPVRFVALWVSSAAVSAFTFGLMTGFEASVLIGASGVVSAATGAVCRFAIPRSGFAPAKLVHAGPLLSITDALRRRSVLAFIGFWLFVNLLFAFGMVVGGGDGNAVAWQAHLGGFLFGYLAFGLFDRKAQRA